MVLLCHVLLPWCAASDPTQLGHSVMDRNMDRHWRGPGKQRHSKERRFNSPLDDQAIDAIDSRNLGFPPAISLWEMDKAEAWCRPGAFFSVKTFHQVLTIY